MTILSIRTDNPQAEIGLFKEQTKLAYFEWPAHRQLAETLHTKIMELLHEKKLELEDIDGLIVFQGPGSFTGLRIGVSVANALAYSLGVPVAASQSADWQVDAINDLIRRSSRGYALPEYGGQKVV